MQSFAPPHCAAWPSSCGGREASADDHRASRRWKIIAEDFRWSLARAASLSDFGKESPLSLASSIFLWPRNAAGFVRREKLFYCGMRKQRHSAPNSKASSKVMFVLFHGSRNNKMGGVAEQGYSAFAH